MEKPFPEVDCVIVGAGPAGLSAAIYLARFRRSVQVIDAGNSRAALIPLSRNYPGFPEGVAGKELLARLRAQAARFGVEVIAGKVQRLEKQGEGFLVRSDQGAMRSRKVLLATGLRDIEPKIPAIRQAIQNGHVRYCPICDGYEAQGKSVAVIGQGEHSLNEVLFIRHFTDRLTFLALEAEPGLSQEERQLLADRGIRLIQGPVADIVIEGEQVTVVRMEDTQAHHFDTVYSMLGTRVQSELAQALGADTDAEDNLLVDAHLQTSISGLYAAGDVVSGLNQIAVATGQAAIAATAIHNQL